MILNHLIQSIIELEAVANFKSFNFETWTQSIGLLGHAGFGLAMLERRSYLRKRQNG
jgi:OOP family OmpA-OmpF porin